MILKGNYSLNNGQKLIQPNSIMTRMSFFELHGASRLY